MSGTAGKPKRGAARVGLQLFSALMLSAALGTVAGCGGTVQVKLGQTLDVGLAEYRLTPDDVQAASGYLTIVVHNYGRLTHDLVLSDGKHWVASTRPLWPGQSAELTVALPPGRYSMFSALLSDQALGQYGTLRVSG